MCSKYEAVKWQAIVLPMEGEIIFVSSRPCTCPHANTEQMVRAAGRNSRRHDVALCPMMTSTAEGKGGGGGGHMLPRQGGLSLVLCRSSFRQQHCPVSSLEKNAKLTCIASASQFDSPLLRLETICESAIMRVWMSAFNLSMDK